MQDFVFSVFDNIVTENPEVAYIKWDANADIMNYGSHYLPADKQSQIYIDYQLGMRNVLKRLREKHPDVSTTATCPTLTNSGPRTTPTLTSACSCSGEHRTSIPRSQWPHT